MKKVFIGILLSILFISFSAYAINFKPKDEYNSVVVVYSDVGVGSGFSVSDNLIISNAHVVGNSDEVSIKLYSGEEIKGKVVKKDENIDLAAIRIEEKIPTLSYADEEPEIGSEVYAIGTPKNMPYTMTKGIISALDREIGKNKYIQIDASVNEGNSGGPLVNDSGKVIGVITLKAVDADGIGFAINKKDVIEFTKQIGDVSANNSSYENDSLTENNKELNIKNKFLVKTVIILSIIIFVLLIICCLLIISNKSKKREIYYRSIKNTEGKDKEKYDFEIEIED